MKQHRDARDETERVRKRNSYPDLLSVFCPRADGAPDCLRRIYVVVVWDLGIICAYVIYPFVPCHYCEQKCAVRLIF